MHHNRLTALQHALRRPDQMPTRWAKSLVALALFILLLALAGLSLYDGWHRLAYVTAFVAMALGNLALAAQRLLPNGPAKRLAALALLPLSTLMMLALAATLAFQYGLGS